MSPFKVKTTVLLNTSKLLLTPEKHISSGGITEEKIFTFLVVLTRVKLCSLRNHCELTTMGTKNRKKKIKQIRISVDGTVTPQRLDTFEQGFQSHLHSFSSKAQAIYK